MRNRTQSFRFLLALFASLVFVACANQQEPAKKLLADVESAIAAAGTDAQQYIPEKYAAVQQKLTDMKAAFDKQDYKSIITGGPALLADAQALATEAAAKKKEVLEALNSQWTALAAQVPQTVSAIEARLATFKKSHSLPKGVTKDSVAAANAGLGDLKTAWSDATTAFGSGKLQEALDKAKAVKAKAEDIAAKLGIGGDAKPAA